MIKNIKLFPNNNIRSLEAADFICDRLSSNGFTVCDYGCDLAIAIGGDGSFLRMVHDNNFDGNIYYVGVNLGTLGFAQDVNIDKLDDFINELTIGCFKTFELGVQETFVKCSENLKNFYSLDEIVLRDRNLGALRINITIDDILLERFVGDGILVATPFGSTAQNKSYGGSIIFNDLNCLQITPIAPINSSVFRTISNSIVVPPMYDISFIPFNDNTNMNVLVDGKLNTYNNVSEVRTRMGNKKIKCLKLNNYNFTRKLNEKFLNG